MCKNKQLNRMSGGAGDGVALAISLLPIFFFGVCMCVPSLQFGERRPGINLKYKQNRRAMR